MFFLNLIASIIGVIFGGYILFAGRKAVWATLGIAGLATTANLLAVLVAGVENGRDLIEVQAWGLLGITLLVGILGIALGRYKPDMAVLFIGFIAGVGIGLWFYDISAYLITTVAQQTERAATGMGLVILVIGGLFGLWLVRKTRDEALIFITMLVGVQLIQDSLGLSETSSWAAIILISLALAGVLVQYAGYLRELKADQIEPALDISSVVYFQNLELDS